MIVQFGLHGGHAELLIDQRRPAVNVLHGLHFRSDIRERREALHGLRESQGQHVHTGAIDRTQIREIDAGGHGHGESVDEELVPIMQGRDYGTEVEVVSGISGSDQVIVNPPDSLTSGMTVRLAASPVAKNHDDGRPPAEGART